MPKLQLALQYIPQLCMLAISGTVVLEIRDEVKAEGLESSLEAIDKTREEWETLTKDYGIKLPPI